MTISKIQAIKPNKNQIDAINQLIRQSKSHWGYDEDLLDRYIKIMGINESYLEKNTAYLIYSHDACIGFYSFKKNDDDSLELDKCYLHPAYIGQGYGRLLWQACCDTAKQMGAKAFIIWSDFHTETFYLKMGCVKIGTRQSPIRPEIHPPLLKYVMV